MGSLSELHTDLIKSNVEGGLNEVWKGKKVLLSDTSFYFIIPNNVKKNYTAIQADSVSNKFVTTKFKKNFCM